MINDSCDQNEIKIKNSEQQIWFYRPAKKLVAKARNNGSLER